MDDIELIPNLVEEETEDIVYDEVPTKVGIDPEINGTSAMAELDKSKKIPVTILTGYLGSGKSTLLEKIALKGEKRIAVLLNEFGDSTVIERTINIKNSTNGQIEEWVDLGNGCICCSVKDNGVAAIERLVKKRSNFDHIILETTGLADPGPIIKMFWMDDAIASNIYIDGVVCVLDGENILRSLNEDSHGGLTVAHIQIAMADVLILNKMDRVTEIDEIRQRIKIINPLIPIIETKYGEIDLKLILNLHSFDSYNKINLNISNSVAHNHNMGSISIDFKKFETWEQFARFEAILQNLLWNEEEKDYEIHRAKGLIFIGDTEYRVIQGVRKTYEVIEGYQSISEIELNANRLVLIGTGLNKFKNEFEQKLLSSFI